MTDFGNEVIQSLREEGLYGMFFSYEEYQKLKNVKTKREFATFASAVKKGYLAAATEPSAVIKTIQMRYLKRLIVLMISFCVFQFLFRSYLVGAVYLPYTAYLVFDWSRRKKAAKELAARL